MRCITFFVWESRYVIFNIMIQDETLIFMPNPEGMESMGYGVFRMMLYCQ